MANHAASFVNNTNQGWSAVLRANLDLIPGEYVVQEGYWAYDSSGTLRYYDNAQSPVIYL